MNNRVHRLTSMLRSMAIHNHLPILEGAGDLSSHFRVWKENCRGVMNPCEKFKAENFILTWLAKICSRKNYRYMDLAEFVSSHSI